LDEVEPELGLYSPPENLNYEEPRVGELSLQPTPSTSLGFDPGVWFDMEKS